MTPHRWRRFVMDPSHFDQIGADDRRVGFGPFVLDLERQALLKHGRDTGLRSRSFKVLAHLIACAPRVVPSTELEERYWEPRNVCFNSVSGCIAECRKALGDSWKRPVYIETVRKGYRFLPKVEQILPAWRVPRDRNDWFTGRVRELRDIRDRFCFSKVQVIVGTPGIGKSSAALEYCYRHRTDYSGVLWIDASSEEVLTREIMETVRALHLAAEDFQEAVTALERWMAYNENWLIVFDGITDLQLVEQHLEAKAKGNFLVTTTDRSRELGEVLQLPPLGEMEAKELLRVCAKNRNFSAEEEAALDQLLEEMAGLPLALTLTGLDLRTSNSIDYLTRYRQDSRRSESGVHTAAKLHLRSLTVALPKDVRDALRLAAFFSNTIPFELGETFNASSGLTDTLAVLGENSLIEVHPDQRTFEIHSFLRRMILASLGQHYSTYLKRSIECLEKCLPKPSVEYWHIYLKLIEHAFAVTDHAEKAGFSSPAVVRILIDTAWYYLQTGLYERAKRASNRVLLKTEDVAAPNRFEAIIVLLMAQRQLREPTAPAYESEAWSILRKDLERVRESGLRRRVTRTFFEAPSAAAPIWKHILHSQGGLRASEDIELLLKLTILYRKARHYEKARQFSEHLLQIVNRRFGQDHLCYAFALSEKGILHMATSQPREAIGPLLSSLGILEDAFGKRHPILLDDLKCLAASLIQLKEYDKAHRMIDRMFVIQRKLPEDHPSVYDGHDILSTLCLKQGRMLEAECILQKTLRKQRENPKIEEIEIAETLHSLGSLYTILGYARKAKRHLRQALVKQQRIRGLLSRDVISTLAYYVLTLEGEENWKAANLLRKRVVRMIEASSYFNSPFSSSKTVESIYGLFLKEINPPKKSCEKEKEEERIRRRTVAQRIGDRILRTLIGRDKKTPSTTSPRARQRHEDSAIRHI